MLRNLCFALVLGTAAAGSSCAPAHVQVAAEVSGPRLALVSPGVWLVEDHAYAVYYADGVYWRYIDGIWYQSSFYDGGFVRVNVGIVPRVIVRAYRPHHVRYRPARHVQRRPIVRTQRPRRR